MSERIPILPKISDMREPFVVERIIKPKPMKGVDRHLDDIYPFTEDHRDDPDIDFPLEE
jgi:hypothetical protein